MEDCRREAPASYQSDDVINKVERCPCHMILWRGKHNIRGRNDKEFGFYQLWLRCYLRPNLKFNL